MHRQSNDIEALTLTDFMLIYVVEIQGLVPFNKLDSIFHTKYIFKDIEKMDFCLYVLKDDFIYDGLTFNKQIVS